MRSISNGKQPPTVCAACYSKNPDCPICLGSFIVLDLEAPAMQPTNHTNLYKIQQPTLSDWCSEIFGEKKPSKTPQNPLLWGEVSLENNLAY